MALDPVLGLVQGLLSDALVCPELEPNGDRISRRVVKGDLGRHCTEEVIALEASALVLLLDMI